MHRKSNELVVGISVTVATLLVVFGVLFFERPTLFTGSVLIHINTGSANGIRKSDDVQYRGLKVGSVQSVKLVDGDVQITARLNTEAQIPKDSRFVIESAGLLSGEVVTIVPGSSDQYLQDGATVHATEGSGISSLVNQGGQIGSQLNDLLSSLQGLPTQQIQSEVQQVLKDLKSASDTLNATIENNRSDVAAIISNLEQLTGSNDKRISDIITSLQQSRDNWTATLDQAQTATQRVDTLLGNIESGQGTMGQILTDDALYRNVNDAVQSVQQLADDIRQNPGRYFKIKIF